MVPVRDRIEHRWVQVRMSDYVDGELSPRSRRRVDRHADRCPECGPLRRAFVRITSALHELRQPPDPSVAPGVIRHLRRSDGERDD
jgi:anti-sigma factor RsiW